MKELVFIIVLIVIILLFIRRSNEHFDTYRNHNEFANEYYKKHDPGILGKLNVHKTDLYAKYMWNEKNKDGLELYDHYYEDLNNCNYFNPMGFYQYKKGKRFDPYIYFNGQKISLNQKNY